MRKVTYAPKRYWKILVVIGSCVVTAVAFFSDLKSLLPGGSESSLNKENYSVSSFGQQGGITAGKVIVNGRQPRHLTPENILKLNAFLPSSKATGIEISYLVDNAEAQAYATEIQDYLLSQGWRVDPFLTPTKPFDGPVVGVRVIRSATGGNWEFLVGANE
jgi:hypothetical protein